MAESPATRPSLLLRIRDPHDNDAWRQFLEVYEPLVYKYMRGKGLQHADAADLTQEVVHAAVRVQYDPGRGRFRGWLFTVAQRKLAAHFERRKRQPPASAKPEAQCPLEEIPDREDADQWDRDYQQRIFSWAAEQVRAHFEDKSWQAFWRTAVQGQSAKDVAALLGISLGAVYVAKSKIQARIRDLVHQVDPE